MTPLDLHIPVLETERLWLRAPRMSDFEPLWSFFQSERSRFVRAPEIDRLSTARALAHMAGLWVLRGYGPFILEDKQTGRAIGLAGIWQPMVWPEPELSWSIWDAAAEGKGLAQEAARAALADAYVRVGLPPLVSYIDPENLRSIALAERLGARVDPAAQTPPDFGACRVYRHADRVPA